MLLIEKINFETYHSDATETFRTGVDLTPCASCETCDEIEGINSPGILAKRLRRSQ
jgi:hypothetical protein